jgi:hypothetical protein
MNVRLADMCKLRLSIFQRRANIFSVAADDKADIQRAKNKFNSTYFEFKRKQHDLYFFGILVCMVFADY